MVLPGEWQGVRSQTSLYTITPAAGEILGWGRGCGYSLEKASSLLLAFFGDLTSKRFISLPGGGRQKIQLVGLSSKKGCKMFLCTRGPSACCDWNAVRTAVRTMRVVLHPLSRGARSTRAQFICVECSHKHAIMLEVDKSYRHEQQT